MPAMPMLRMVGMLQRMSVQLELVSPLQCAAYEPLPRNVDLIRQRAPTFKQRAVTAGS